MIRILVLGDVMGIAGRKALKKNLSRIISENKINFSIINGENAADDGKGITKKIAEDFIACGAKVLITGTNENLLKKTKHDLGRNCDFFVCNLSQIGELESLHLAAVEFFGPIDTLVNNAGITRDGLFMRMPEENWLDVMQVNLHSTVKLSQMVIRSMKPQ